MKERYPNKVISNWTPFAVELILIYKRGQAIQKTPFQLNPFPSVQPDHKQPAVDLFNSSPTDWFVPVQWGCGCRPWRGTHTLTHTHCHRAIHTRTHGPLTRHWLRRGVPTLRWEIPAPPTTHSTRFRLNRLSNNVIKSTLGIADDPLCASKEQIYYWIINISK